MSLKDYCFDGSKKLDLGKMPTDGKKDGIVKEDIAAKTKKNHEKIFALQDKFYADGHEGLLIVLQAMDAAGKDSTVKHVMSGVNPQGIDVYSFKQPTSTELAHDFLWRVNRCLPVRGKIAMFNRSYYEDVLVVKVHEINKTYHMAKRVIDDPDFFEKRYRQICDYERYLYENSYRVIKIFLNVSLDEQKKRFLERIDDPEKNWKFSSSDLKERARWDDYHKAYEDAVNATATPEAPWYVLPADQKWYTRYLVSEAILKVLEDIDPQYPELPDEQKALLADNKKELTSGALDEAAIKEAEKESRKAQKETEKEARAAKKAMKKDKKKTDKKAEKNEKAGKNGASAGQVLSAEKPVKKPAKKAEKKPEKKPVKKLEKKPEKKPVKKTVKKSAAKI
ncbi:MAG: polyphosphate kinase 2 family protein [Lachnospiraceae bacterium]|jgi:PPK2 family polyphosphate:nucleotide phosphotransferase|nr:polyphosphate kinase 2 family protein [Lachnospiraceae bacterium]